MTSSARSQHTDAAFANDELGWFESFEPFDYEDDGSHALNGLARPLDEYATSRAPTDRRWTAFAILGVAGIATGSLFGAISSMSL